MGSTMHHTRMKFQLRAANPTMKIPFIHSVKVAQNRAYKRYKIQLVNLHNFSNNFFLP